MGCTKKKFISRSLAKKNMERMNLKYRDQPLLDHVYKCLDCNHWHVTHMSKDEVRDLKEIGRIKQSPVSEELAALRKAVNKKR